MARIRTIKPEFWTDPKIVALPFEARLLFIGLWNLADDHGLLDYDPDRIKLQIFPADMVDVAELLDILMIDGFISILSLENSKEAIEIVNFNVHQKIDHPSKSKILIEGGCFKKKPVRTAERQALAKSYGCIPGQKVSANCAYCGDPGEINWWPKKNGKPSFWVTFSLEIDHITPESKGGSSTVENLILACRSCNRRKADGEANVIRFAKPREDSREIALEGKGKERKGKEGKGTSTEVGPSAPVVVKSLTPIQKVVRAYKAAKNINVDDKAWDKACFPRAAKAAQSLIECFGAHEPAMIFLIEKGQQFDEKGLDWTLETIKKHAWDSRGKFNGGDDGHKDSAVDANSISERRGPGRLASARDIVKELGFDRDLPPQRNAEEVQPEPFLAERDGFDGPGDGDQGFPG